MPAAPPPPVAVPPPSPIHAAADSFCAAINKLIGTESPLLCSPRRSATAPDDAAPPLTAEPPADGCACCTAAPKA
ncbi:hypothetical protein AB1Y20_016994 [Prymnesium parvum]|uniref:Uncharacterized protein n=1 Tax=Prymnesium parvum TaxID=97485 RepID=A0AB34I8M3_PRYPA